MGVKERVMLGFGKERDFIVINLIGTEADDGRVYVNSPDLEGFHFILEPGEDPMPAMEPTLKEFMNLYIEAEISTLSLAPNPKQYKQKMMNIPSGIMGIWEHTVVAEVA